MQRAATIPVPPCLDSWPNPDCYLVMNIHGPQSPHVLGQQHVDLHAHWSYPYPPYSRIENKVSSNITSSYLYSSRYTVPNHTANPTLHSNLHLSSNKELREYFDTPSLRALQSPAMKAVSSSKLCFWHPRVYWKLIPDSFSTYNLLLISIVAYKALAPSDTSFLPNSSPYNILQ